VAEGWGRTKERKLPASQEHVGGVHQVTSPRTQTQKEPLNDKKKAFGPKLCPLQSEEGQKAKMSRAVVRRDPASRMFRVAACASVLLLAGGLAARAASAAQQTQSPAPPAPPQPAHAVADPPANPAPVAVPQWDVSTVKPSSPDERGSMIQFTDDGVKITNVPLFTIVREGFTLHDDRIFGTSGQKNMGNVDIEAKVAPQDVPKLKSLSFDQRRAMFITLLEERCGLKYHHETRELPEYDLVVARGGVKMMPSKPDVDQEDAPPRPSQAAGQPPKQGNHSMMGRRGHLESTGTDVEVLARVLSDQLGRTVVDKTGLKGNYDFKLDWTPDDAGSAVPKNGSSAPGDNAAAPGAGGPSLFTALEEQLGLKLEATKGPVDVVVIDQLQQPTAN
jgi:uncharacterized protein (TIGR03435 family)